MAPQSRAHDHPVAGALRAAGLRVTQTRCVVHDALAANPHSTADDLSVHVAAVLPGTSLQSVYNALTDFVAAGIARRIKPADHAAHFELRVDDNHHHLICTSCGAIVDVDCVTGSAPCLTAGDASGYVVHTAEVTFWGLCPTCAASGSAPNDDIRTSETSEHLRGIA